MEKILGVDPGFGNFKVAAPDSAAVVVPSVVGVGSTDTGMLSLGTFSRGRHRGSTPDEVAFQGVTYLVGEGVARFARPVQRMDFLRLSDGPELRSLFYDALYGALGPDAEGAVLSLMVGLPVEVLADTESARATVQGLRSWVVGEHAFAVNGVSRVVRVAAMKAMAQPAGAFFSWGLNPDGRWSRDKADLKAPVAICDIGFNTLDVFTVQAGEVVARYTGGDTAGMRRATELLIGAVQSRYGVQLSLHEADSLIRQRDPRLYTSDGEAALAPLARQALDTAAAGIATFLEQRWGNGKQFAHLLFTGGGASVLKDALLRQYPHGEVLPDPVGANAVGLARYGVRVFH